MLGVFPLCYYLVYTEDTINLQKDSNFAKKKNQHPYPIREKLLMCYLWQTPKSAKEKKLGH